MIWKSPPKGGDLFLHSGRKYSTIEAKEGASWRKWKHLRNGLKKAAQSSSSVAQE